VEFDFTFSLDLPGIPSIIGGEDVHSRRANKPDG